MHAFSVTSSTLLVQHIMNALCGVCVTADAMSTVLANERLAQEIMLSCTALLEQPAVLKYVLAVAFT